MTPNLSQQLVPLQRQEMHLSPLQILSLQYLQLSVQKLEEKLQEEARKNPAIELQRPEAEVLAGDLGRGNLLEGAGGGDDYGGDYGGSGGQDGEEADRRRKERFDSVVRQRTLQDDLQEQLGGEEGLSDEERLVAEEIIGNLDGHGFLRASLEELAEITGTDTGLVEELLRMVQGYEPPGVGARNLQECLRLQLDRLPERPPPLARTLLQDHFQELENPKALMRKLKVSEKEMERALKIIRGLNPNPGSAYETVSPSEIIVPDLLFKKDDAGGWRVEVNRLYMPRPVLSREYQALLKNPELTPEEKAEGRKNLAAAQVAIQAVGQYQSTLERLGEALLELQPDYFARGPDGLKPLTQAKLAERLGVHPATVSRAAKDKYAQTPLEMRPRPLREFFMGGIAGPGGEMVASEVVHRRLRELIAAEDPRRPCSDETLRERLAETGIVLARRTVAKYREELKIPGSSARRR